MKESTKELLKKISEMESEDEEAAKLPLFAQVDQLRLCFDALEDIERDMTVTDDLCHLCTIHEWLEAIVRDMLETQAGFYL